MEAFNLVIFGFSGNLAQLKIIPALYDLEEKGLLSKDTKIYGIGRKEINTGFFINDILHSENRHHLHKIDPKIQSKLVERTFYLQENFEENEGSLYSNLQNINGNILFYLATYPNLYKKIFQSIKDFGLNKRPGGWVRIMIEKPIGNDLATAIDLDNLLNQYFNESQIFRVDHYLGKNALRKIFGTGVKSTNTERIEIYISEDFGIGKRGVYYDSTGALIDMGQNHLLQMLAAVTAKSENREDRAEVLESLIPQPENIVFGQYEGYLNEDQVKQGSKTDTYFALKTSLNSGPWSGVPIYLSSGKKLNKNEIKIIIHYKDRSKIDFTIAPSLKAEKYDPYERLIMDAVNGDQTFFNTRREIEASWKFIDRLSLNRRNLFIYKPGSNLSDGVASKFPAQR